MHVVCNLVNGHILQAIMVSPDEHAPTIAAQLVMEQCPEADEDEVVETLAHEYLWESADYPEDSGFCVQIIKMESA